MSRLTVGEIAQMMRDRSEEIAKHLLPNGRLVCGEWLVGSINGEPGQSMKVYVSGSKIGIWSDFASGQAGDLLDLWRVVRGHSANKDALTEIKAFMGISEPELTTAGKKKYRKPEAAKGTKQAVEGSAVMKYLTEERKLTLDAIRAYGIGEVAEVGPWENWQRQEPAKGPWIVFPYLRGGEMVGVKYLHLNRRDGKKFTLVEPGCEPVCFGWRTISPTAREITICEGELDAVSLHIYGRPTISVPFGGGRGEKQQWVNSDWEWLEQFETIYLCMDVDKAGQEATDELVQRLGIYRCKIVTLPRKDANQCLQDGITKEEIDKCFASARMIEPEELRPANAYTDEVISEFYPSGGQLPGFDAPWEKVPMRFLRGEVSTITGVNSHGKSLLWSHIELAGMEQGEKFCVASFEMAPKKTLYRMARQATGKKFPSKDEITACMEWLTGKVWLFHLVGTGKVGRMLEVFEFAFRRYGVKQFVIDSLMKVGIAEDDYRGQKEFIDLLCDFAARTGAHVHLVAHSRKGDSETTPVGKLDIKGTGAISDLAFNCFSVWRNKNKEGIMGAIANGEPVELPRGKTIEGIEQEPDAILYIDKSRNVEDAEGKFALWYDAPSMQYLERQHMTAKPYFLTPEAAEEADAPF
jgi:twinkle protein